MSISAMNMPNAITAKIRYLVEFGSDEGAGNAAATTAGLAGFVTKLASIGEDPLQLDDDCHIIAIIQRAQVEKRHALRHRAQAAHPRESAEGCRQGNSRQGARSYRRRR